ncbi:hypothetical protein [Vibrio crassostreae]|nr:hypothetical protein [Vibrio crassostreae]
MAGKNGLLAIHDAGSIAVSKDHKPLLCGFEPLCEVAGGYVVLKRPTPRQKQIIMNRLFLLPDAY